MGRFFYKLADKYKKSKWGYAILGIVTYYAVFYFVGIIYVIIYFMNNPLADENDINERAISLISFPFGLGGSYVLYYLLQRSWKKNALKDKVSIDDIGKEI